ncbi:MAG: hypothetical protein NWR73_02480 [Flavobacteriales bacterium]|nr:hypothetical protein [Flavobacteriales bacterium]
MKQFWSVLGAVLMVSLVNAQDLGASRLEAAFSSAELAAMDQSQSDQLAFWSLNGWQFIVDAKISDEMLDIADLTPKSNAPALTAENFNPETFNPLLYSVELSDDKPTYYRVGDTGVLFFFSNDRFNVLNERNNVNQAAAANRQGK